jgi:hypothetical protein
MLVRIGYEHLKYRNTRGVVRIVEFTKITKDSTNLHDNK